MDLKKDAQLIRAYNDAAGVTAAFNLNLLTRINREPKARSISMASATRRFTIPRRPLEIRVSIRIVRESGPVVSIFCRRNDPYRELLQIFYQPISRYLLLGGMAPGRVWTDGQNLFSVHELTPTASEQR